MKHLKKIWRALMWAVITVLLLTCSKSTDLHIDANRLRLLFLKHNHILDVADEYYHTDGFGNFDEIMAGFDFSNW